MNFVGPLATTSTPWTVGAVVIGCLAGAALCLFFAIVFAVQEILSDARKEFRKKAAEGLAGSRTLVAADFDGMAKLATALEHLDLSGRFLLFSLGFAASAAAAAAAGLAAVH